ncbi:hypothetical protein JRO89_XS13G0113400 [Xanthoceras sorbifolium]|uniref:Elongin-C n=1 Tax=Xanthoceras sorbifolium TaxID=99658 RepID=A0ABQ8H7S9_9ROSI|nr:hypothetical protein JRO89_XS13G0113400 [Xanthoceras sorbifolium]
MNVRSMERFCTLGTVDSPLLAGTVAIEELGDYINAAKYALENRGKETDFHIEPELTLELMMAANYLHT